MTGANGVRVPILVEGELGIPTFGAAVFAGQQLRHPDGSPNSDAQVLTSVACWEDYKARRAIDWNKRVLARKFLLAHEIVDFVRHLYIPRCSATGSVLAGTVDTRIDCVIPYIVWEIERITSLDWQSAEHFKAAQVAVATFIARLGQARPRCDKLSDPRSLTPDQSTALQELLHPADGVGMWKDEFVADRNGCFHDWQDETGHRVGELLSIRLHEIDFKRRTPITPSGGQTSTPIYNLFRLFWRFNASLQPERDAFPRLAAHHDRMLARPAVRRTIDVEAAIGYELPA